MVSLILIGFIGGVLTSLSPCIIPVLPLVLAVSAGDKRRPYYVVAGMVVSFAAITLSGSIVLNLLGLPQDTVRWVGIGLLVLVGLGMLIPVLGEWVQAPFDRLPRLHALLTKAQGRGGFVVGLALGAVYVPCAGPVLAAITVAAATGAIDAFDHRVDHRVCHWCGHSAVHVCPWWQSHERLVSIPPHRFSTLGRCRCHRHGGPACCRCPNGPPTARARLDQ